MAGIVDIDDAVQMRLDGSTFQEIGQKYGVSRQAVFDLFARHRITPRRYTRIYQNIPYKGLRDFVQANPNMSLSALTYLICGSAGKAAVERTRRLLKGCDCTLSLSQIRRLESKSGMSFDELFALDGPANQRGTR